MDSRMLIWVVVGFVALHSRICYECGFPLPVVPRVKRSFIKTNKTWGWRNPAALLSDSRVRAFGGFRGVVVDVAFFDTSRIRLDASSVFGCADAELR